MIFKTNKKNMLMLALLANSTLIASDVVETATHQSEKKLPDNPAKEPEKKADNNAPLTKQEVEEAVKKALNNSTSFSTVWSGTWRFLVIAVGTFAISCVCAHAGGFI